MHSPHFSLHPGPAIAMLLALAAAGCGDSQRTLGPSAVQVADFPVDFERLREALIRARNENNGGFNLDMWATIVNRDGFVVAVAFTGEGRGSQWPGSRVISAQKANTANSFSLKGLALSTANLWAPSQPGGSLFGLQESNPVNTDVAYGGNPATYGTPNDFMVGKKIGGVNVFGGGFALYDGTGRIIGAVGVSGDSSCADHNIAWKVRDFLALDFVPGGVSLTGDDNIIYDLTNEFGHPDCGHGEAPISEALPTTNPISTPLS